MVWASIRCSFLTRQQEILDALPVGLAIMRFTQFMQFWQAEARAPSRGVDVKEACGDAFFFGIVDFGFHAGADAVVPKDPELVASGEDLTVELDAQGSFFGIVVV